MERYLLKVRWRSGFTNKFIMTAINLEHLLGLMEVHGISITGMCSEKPRIRFVGEIK